MPDLDTLALLQEAARVLRDPDLAPDERHLRVEEMVPALVRARYGAGDVRLADSAKEAGLASLLATARREPGPSAGRSPIGGRGAAGRHVAWRWATAAALAGVLAVLYLAFSRPHGGPDRIVRGPGSARPLPAGPPTLREAPRAARRPPTVTVRRPAPPAGRVPPEGGRRVVRGPGAEPAVPQPAPRVAAGAVTQTMGEPRVVEPGQAGARVARRGLVVYAGSRIETGDADQATIRLADGTTFDLGYNTVFRLGPAKVPTGARPGAGREYDLAAGSVYAKAAHQPDGAPLSVETPAATAQVVGTEFQLRVRRRPRAGTEATLSVREGRVVFFNAHGRVECARMTQSLALPYAAPTAPRGIRYIRSIGYTTVLHTHRLTLAECTERLVWTPGYTGLRLVDRLLPGKSWPWETQLMDEPVRLAAAPTVVSVEPGSPAYRAGLRTGDIVLRVGEREVSSAHAAELAMNSRPPGNLAITSQRGAMVRRVRIRTTGQVGAAIPRLRGRERRLVDAGTRLFLAGDLHGAAAAYQRAFRLTGSAAALHNLGLALQYEGRLPEAVKALQGAMRRRPRVALYGYDLGLALLDIGNPERAVDCFRAAERLAPGWEDPRAATAFAYSNDTGEYDNALAATRRWIAAQPHSALAWAAKAHGLRLAGRLDEALRAARRAIALDGTLTGPYGDAADVYRARSLPERSEQMRLRALRANAGDPHLFSGLALAFADEGRLGEAVIATRCALALAPDDFVFYTNLSSVYQRQGDLGRAVRYARKAVALEPRFGMAYLSLAAALLADGRPREAESVARQAVELSPDRAIALDTMGMVLFEQNRLPEAERHFRAAVGLDPALAASYANLAVVCLRTGRQAEAQRHAEKALTLERGTAESHWSVGMAMVVLRRYADAERCFRAAYALAPDDPRNARAIADACRAQGKHADAERYYQEAIRKRPNDLQTHLRLASMLEDLGRLPEAEKEFRAAVPPGADGVLALGQLALFLSRHPGRADGGLAVAEQCVELARGDASRGMALGFLGLVRLRRGEMDKAEQALRESVRLAPNATRWNRLADVLERTGRPDEAAEAYRKALALDVNDRAAQTGLKRGESAGAQRLP